jgi:putative Ca2+/H+ antiporter (TMEM165/GDT1 family)
MMTPSMETNLFQHSADWTLFFSTFAVIFLAELPDKTAVAILLMAAQRHPWGVWVGVCLAYVVQNCVAILFGGLLALLPPHWIHMGSGLLFLLFAALMWMKKEEKGKAPQLSTHAHFAKTIGTAFIVIFIAEWGDLTQIATAALVAKTKHTATIFLASTSALFAASGILVYIGHRAKKVIHPQLLQKIAAVAFAIVGILLLSGFWDK